MSAVVSSFYIVGGTLRFDSPSYVERQADRDLYDGLTRGEFCYVLTSRQIGKSSLMVRTANKLRAQETSVVVLDLTAIGQNLTPEQWYDGLEMSLGRQLRLEDELEEFWKSHERLSPVQRFVTALREVVMVKRTGPIVIFIDEIDNVRSLPFSTDEFFAAIRECYNRRTEDVEFNRLTFCLLGVAIPSDLIRDTRITPFNIGRRIELNDFTAAEAAPLANGLRRDAKVATELFERIHYWTNGHPYLTQRLCRTVADDATANTVADVDRICEALFLSSRAKERDDNLMFVRERLLRSEVNRADLLSLYDLIRRGKRARDDEASPLVNVLRLSGIVRADHGTLQIRNRIYQHVYNEAWVKANMPDQEIRRQREAFRRGLMRGSVFVVFCVAIGLFVASLVRDRLEAQQVEQAKRAIGSMYGNLNSYSDFMEMKQDIVWEGGSRLIHPTSFTLHAQRPNKFLLQVKLRQQFGNYSSINEIVLHSDGEELTEYSESAQQYRVTKAPDSLRTALTQELGTLGRDLSETVYPLIFANNAGRVFAEKAKNVTFLRKEPFAGIPAYVFSWQEAPARETRDAAGKQVEVIAWVARDDGRILQVEKNVTGLRLPPGSGRGFRGEPGGRGLGRGGPGGRGGGRGPAPDRPQAGDVSEFKLRMEHSHIRLNPSFTNELNFSVSTLGARKVAQFRPGTFGFAPSGSDRDPQQIDRARLAELIPQRDRAAQPEQIDLSSHFTEALTESWLPGRQENELAELPRGLQNLAGVEFDVRGVVQLSSARPDMQKYPEEIEAIAVKQQCKQIHFLHGAIGTGIPDGNQIGAYLIHYADEERRVVPIIYGFDLRGTGRDRNEPSSATGLTIAWAESNALVTQGNNPIRFYKTSWTNPRPTVVIESIEFVSSLESSAPFLIAITVK